MKAAVVLTCALALHCAARAAVLSVPDDYPTIQAGIGAANDGDTVLVRAGVYYENIRFRGKAIRVTALAARLSRPAGEAVIDGSFPSNPDSSAAVYFVGGEDENAVIEGFTITHDAFRRGEGRANGEGIVCDMASPTVTGNVIVGNSPHGIRYRDAGETRMLRVLGNEIRWNSSGDAGGGIFIEESVGPGGSNALVEGNLIVGNTAESGGAFAARFTQASKITLRGNHMSSNAAAHGACVRTEKCDSEVLIERNVMTGNDGTAISVYDYAPGSSVVAVNNTIVANAHGVVLEDAGDAVLRNNIIAGNGSGITLVYLEEYSGAYNDLWDNAGKDYVGCEPGEGDISEDPAFAGGIPFDYHLRSDSPCIDAGDPADPPDPDGTRVDMGALWHDQTGGVHAGDAPILSLAVWPSPSRGAAHIELDLATTTPRVEVVLYDASGRVIRRLYEGPAGAGRLVLDWDGTAERGGEAPRGVYFVAARSFGSEARARLVKE